MFEPTFHNKALVVTVDKQNINVVTAFLLNMGANILGITDKPHSVSKSNIVAVLKTNDDVKVDVMRRKLEYKYSTKC